MSGPTTAMIMAAGFGTRMGALTASTPKPLLPVAGRALIDHALDYCAAAGVTRHVINLHYLGGQIRDHLATRDDVVFSEEPEILETGGGVTHALPLLSDTPVYTVNSDAIFVGPPALPVLANAWWPDEMDALLLMVRRKAAIAYTRAGDFRLEGRRPVRRGEAATAPYVYSGAQIIRPEAFADAPNGAFSTNVIWDRLNAKGKLAAVVYDGAWVDVGTPEGLKLADEALT